MKFKTLSLLFLFLGINIKGECTQDSDRKTWLYFKVNEDVSSGFGIHQYLSNSFDLNYIFNVGSLDLDEIAPDFRKLF